MNRVIRSRALGVYIFSHCFCDFTTNLLALSVKRSTYFTTYQLSTLRSLSSGRHSVFSPVKHKPSICQRVSSEVCGLVSSQLLTLGCKPSCFYMDRHISIYTVPAALMGEVKAECQELVQNGVSGAVTFCNYQKILKVCATKESVRINGTVRGESNEMCIDQHSKDDKVIIDVVDVAARCLVNGGVVAVPTDTVYGVACLSQNDRSIDKIYEIKGRDCTKPLAICVADIQDVYKWCNVTITPELLHCLLPGPVTLVFERTPALNPRLNPGTPLVGLRIPDSQFIRTVCRACSAPLALTSANISNHSSSLSIQEFDSLWARLDYIFDGGEVGRSSTESKSGSTVIDLSIPGLYKIIRRGSAFDATTSTLTSHGLQENLSS